MATSAPPMDPPSRADCNLIRFAVSWPNQSARNRAILSGMFGYASNVVPLMPTTISLYGDVLLSSSGCCSMMAAIAADAKPAPRVATISHRSVSTWTSFGDIASISNSLHNLDCRSCMDSPLHLSKNVIPEYMAYVSRGCTVLFRSCAQ